jgi:hypothetical protein
VDYELIQGEKGWQARTVQRLSPVPADGQANSGPAGTARA